MTLFWIVLAILGLGMLSGLSRPRHYHRPYDENREAVIDDIDVGGGCDYDCAD